MKNNNIATNTEASNNSHSQNTKSCNAHSTHCHVEFTSTPTATAPVAASPDYWLTMKHCTPSYPTSCVCTWSRQALFGTPEPLRSGYRGRRQIKNYMTRQLIHALNTIPTNEVNLEPKQDTDSNTVSHLEHTNDMDAESDASAQNKLIQNLIYNPSDEDYGSHMQSYHKHTTVANPKENLFTSS
jgi:hypothetical protein